MNITDLKINEKGSILSLNKLDKKFTGRLMDLGIYETAEVIMLNSLPFNKLYIIEVDEVEICLREEDAKLIEVKR